MECRCIADPCSGTGIVGINANRYEKKFVGTELNGRKIDALINAVTAYEQKKAEKEKKRMEKMEEKRKKDMRNFQLIRFTDNEGICGGTEVLSVDNLKRQFKETDIDITINREEDVTSVEQAINAMISPYHADLIKRLEGMF